MQLEQWLIENINTLQRSGITTSRLDCLVLLEDATKKDKSYLLAHPELSLQGLAFKRLNEQIERRSKHEPLAYIRGKSEFYGREFIVNNGTLQPRPETETMIDLLKQLISNKQKSSLLEVGPLTDGEFTSLGIVDVGTGSGCLAVTAKLEFPEAKVMATDISPACLKIARLNAKNLGAYVKFYQGDLLQPLPTTNYQLPSAILANLPYVPDTHPINQAATHEPNIAIFGGLDGLDFYRRLFDQIANLPQKPSYILTESLPSQHATLAHIAKLTDYELAKTADFVQMFKF